ncbi:MAG: hypothetical protein HUJ98_06755, partial [Bacteroidaceae bacterium]|nr:hypothetical protein [Bacteroidaceae bacterium]
DRGFNLIYDGYSYMGYFSNQTLEEGDIIKSGWSAYYIYDELLGSGEVIIAGKAEVPQPKEITPEMLISPQPNWDYQVLMNIHVPNGIDEGYARFNDPLDGDVVIPIKLYNYLNIDEVSSGRYNIRGFWMQLQTDDGYNKVFVPIEFEPYTVKIERLMELEDVLYYTDVDITTDMTVVFANRNINLLYDGVGYMGLVANQALEDGDIINANWSAFYTGYMLVENDGIAIGGKTVVPEPTMVTTEYLMHPQHRWEYLMLLNIYLPDGLGEGTSTVYIHYNDPAEGDVSIPIQFSNYLNINHVRTGRYNIRGFWMPLGHSDQLEFVPIEFVEQYDKIDSLSAFTTIPDNTTIEIAADMTVAFSNEYINLIYDGVNYMGLAANQTLELGDVIKAGWTAVYADKKLQAAEGLTINGKAEVPQPKEITPDMLIYPQPNWDYQVLTPMLLAVNMAQYGMGEAYGQFESEEGPENVPVQVFDVLGIGPVEKGRYNIRGFWMQYNLGDDEYTTVFVPIEFLPYYDKVERLSTLVDFPDKTTIEIAADMTVVYANKVINLIFDGTSYMGLVANRNLEVGDVIKAGWTAVYSERKLHAASTLTIDGSAEVPESKEITPEMLMYQQPNWDYQVLLNIYVPESMEEGMKTVYAQFNDPNEGYLVEIPIQLFNYLSLEDFNPGYYNIRGFWMSVHLGEEYMETFVPIEFIPTKTIIYSLNALIDVHTGEEFIYESDLTVAYVMGDGHIGIYDGRTFGMLFDNHTSLEAGDIIKGGWVGTISSGMLYCTEDLVINSKAESAPIPVSVEAEDINESRIKWNWVTINNITVPDTYCKDFYAYVTCTKEWTEFNWFYIIDRFSITEEGTLEPGVYNVTGTWIKDAEYGWVLSPTSFEDITPIIDSISDIANIPYGTPIVVGVDLSISTQAEDFFEVFDGKKFGAVATHDAMEMIQFDFNNGDIIAKGWRATINNNKITPIFHNLTSDGATTPQPASEVVAINLEGSKYPFNYVTIMNVTVEEPIALNDCAELISIADIYGNTISTSFILNNLYGVVIPAGILDITGIWQWSGDGLGGSQYKLFPLEVRPTEYTGINDVIVDMDKVEYYNMAGMKIDEPKAGSMVIRIANGKAEKFFKK